MDFNKESLSKLLALSDDEMINMLKEIAKESGINADNIRIGKSDIFKIRAFLTMASEEDIVRLLSNFGGRKQ